SQSTRRADPIGRPAGATELLNSSSRIRGCADWCLIYFLRRSNSKKLPKIKNLRVADPDDYPGNDRCLAEPICNLHRRFGCGTTRRFHRANSGTGEHYAGASADRRSHCRRMREILLPLRTVSGVLDKVLLV